MAGENGRTPADLKVPDAAEAARLDFFALVRRLECAARTMPRTGHSLTPADDPVRFGQEPSLRFPASTISSIDRSNEHRPSRMRVNFFGLLGANGPMPTHLTEYVHQRRHHYRDHTLAAFLDVFHHRLLALFYRAWACAKPAVSHDRPDQDRFAFYVASLVGLGGDSFAGREPMADVAKLHYAGLLAGQSRNADGLAALISDDLAVPCSVEQFVGHWVRLPEDARCRLGSDPDTSTLGRSAVVGGRVWDVQRRFRLVLGPMDLPSYERLLPNGPAHRRLAAWVRSHCGFEHEWDARLILLADEVPRTELGRAGRLGWTTWLGRRPHEKDADQLVVHPEAPSAA